MNHSDLDQHQDHPKKKHEVFHVAYRIFLMITIAGTFVVLYFYSKDNTLGCTIEALDFSKELKSFDKLNSVIFGVSPDSIKSHCNFIEKQKLKVNLLSDPNHKVLEKYGAWGIKKNYGKEYRGVIRSTFLINPTQKITFF